MKPFFKYFALAFVFCFSVSGFSQFQNTKWYFGNQAGLDFMTSPPTILTNGVLSTSEGCASIATANGLLEFYTDGITVYNKTHAMMANGNGLTGNPSTTQSGVIVKQPGNTNLYYVFSLGAGGSGSLAYSIVDMNLAGGNGSVTVKNTVLATSMTEKLTSVKHCNGVDFWILSHDQNNNNFRCFLLTSAGITNTVVTAIGSNLTGTAFAGNMKLSPNGKKIGLAAYSQTNYHLYDFDNSTGVVSNGFTLTTPGTGYTYGCEFSPDGTKFYGTKELGTDFLVLYQWDLCAGTPTAVAASLYTTAVTSQIMGMQLANDGKIYIARNGQQDLAVINNPNIMGSGCNYVHSGQSISPKSSSYNLPNFITSGFKPPPPPFTFTVSNLFGCQTASFTAPSIVTNNTVVSCVAAGYSLTGLTWIFGDPASGNNNISSLYNPAHAFTSLGTYTVSLVLNYSCGGGTDTIKQVVNVNQPCISVTSTSITCSNLGSATVAATGGTGPYSYTWMPTAQTSSVATGLSPGSYTITVFDFGNNFTYTANTVFTSLIPLTGSVSNASSVTCFGASTGTGIVTNLAGGSGNQNYSWSNGTQNFTTNPTNSLSAGIWSITVTDQLTGCQVKQSFFVTQPPALSLSLTSSNASVCVGGSVALTGTTSGGTPGYTYSWTNGPGGDTKIVNEPVAGNYLYQLNSLDANNCVKSNTISVLFVANPTLSVADVSICPLTVGTLTATGATSFTWNNVSTGSLFSDNPFSDTQYTVVGAAQGCTAVTTASIILYPLPVPVINHNSPVCNAQNLQFGASGGNSYLWNGPQNFSSNLATAAINNANTNHSGVYQVTVTSVNGCTASASVNLTVNPTPALSATGSTVCTTQTINLFSNSVPGAGFQWTGPQFNSTVQNPSINNPPVSATGNYTVKVTSPQSCTNIAVAHVSVVLPPSLSIVLSDYSLCAQNLNGSNNSINLSANGASSYTLLTPGHISSGGSGPVFPMVTTAPYASMMQTPTVTLIGSNGICSAQKTQTFLIIPNPTISVVPVKPSVCAGQQNTFVAQGASAYAWSPLGTLLINASGNTAISNSASNAVYSVYGASAGCNSATKTTSLMVFPLPLISVSPVTPTICLNEKVTLTTNGTGTSFTWSPFNGLNDVVGSSVIASPGATQNYSVIASVNGCTNIATVTVSVFSLPVPLLTQDKMAVCINGSVTMKGFGGKNYQWYGPLEFYRQEQQVSIIAGNKGVAGIYTLVVTDTNSCKASTITSLNVNPLPAGDLTGPIAGGCVPLCSKFKFNTINSTAVSSHWEIDRQFFNDKFDYCFNEAGVYMIRGKLYDSVTTCTNSLNYEITVHPKPLADFEISPAAPVENVDNVLFTNRSDGEDQVQWSWFFKDEQGAWERKGENSSHFYRESGMYPVAMIVSNKWQCSDSVVKTIRIETDFGIFVPNVFTPNSDGQNEQFIPVVRGVRLINFKVFNRWGIKIFESSGIDHGWDGFYNGQLCKEDVYTWKIVLSTNSGESKEYSGHVSLLR